MPPVYANLPGATGDDLSGQPEQPHIIAIDRDRNALAALREEFGSRAHLVHANFSDIVSVLSGLRLETVSGGILADLGVSSMQLGQPGRGFSFQADGPLDMRMDTSQLLTAENLINSMSEHDLANIIFRYGEERHSKRIARAIARNRPIRSTSQLADLVRRCLAPCGGGRKRQPGRCVKNIGTIHPATRTFQAIRIAVNEELTSLEKFLRDAISVLEPGARLAVITFTALRTGLLRPFLEKRPPRAFVPQDSRYAPAIIDLSC